KASTLPTIPAIYGGVIESPEDASMADIHCRMRAVSRSSLFIRGSLNLGSIPAGYAPKNLLKTAGFTWNLPWSSSQWVCRPPETSI
ncbi:MAG: hypothetical protein AAB307_04680, partial [Deltaproteobacteria bacterium]